MSYQLAKLLLVAAVAISVCSAGGKKPKTDDCNKKCPKNEQRVGCLPCPPTFCNSSYTEYACVAACIPGCTCIKDYLRDNNGVCVPKEECPPPPIICADNEVRTDCLPCEQEVCNTEPSGIICPAVCREGCVCKEGFIRNYQGICIPKDECPPPCGENEKPVGCVPCQEEGCEPQQPKPCPKICKSGCVCKDNFVRDYRGICVKKYQCPPPCGKYQIRVKCKPCQEEKCDPQEPDPKCLVSKICLPGCVCWDNYVRDDNGQCIPKDKCPPPCGKNQERVKCMPCQEENCEPQKPKPCPKICKPGCACKKGFVRDYRGECIRKKECPPPCGKNEQRVECLPCQQETCEPQEPVYCKSVCRTGCVCKKGFVRNEKEECIRKDQCPPPCGKNQHRVECLPCQEPNCEPQKPKFCPAICRPGCTCKKGFKRDIRGECIPEEDCPPPCDENEERVQCKPCQEESCEPQEPEPCPEICISGCVCKKGLVRDCNGKCIPKDDCPKPCGENQERVECIPCQEKSCNPWDPNKVCPLICISGCVCKSGFVRDNDENCIPEDQCPPMCCPKNEVPSDCIPCQPKKCTPPNPDIVCAAVCNKGCVCKDDYVRDEDGNCIPEDECPKPCDD